jgi:hypothetical protein
LFVAELRTPYVALREQSPSFEAPFFLSGGRAPTAVPAGARFSNRCPEGFARQAVAIRNLEVRRRLVPVLAIGRPFDG